MKFTRWFNVAERPVRVGLYQTDEHAGWIGWSWFDGTHFNGAWLSKETALRNADWYERTENEGLMGPLNGFKWRGLSSKDGK